MASWGEQQAGSAQMPVGESTANDYGAASGPRAGFWRRFAALFIDGIILSVIDLVLRIALKGVGADLSLLASILYSTLFIGSAKGQTPGMSAMGIRVISFDGSGSIGYGRAFVRWIGVLLSTIPLFLGFFWMLWDKENQCWQDKLAFDVVVPVSAYPVTRD